MLFCVLECSLNAIILFRIQVEELRSRLTGSERLEPQENLAPSKNGSLLPNSINSSPPALPEKLTHRVEVQRHKRSESNASNGVIVCRL